MADELINTDDTIVDDIKVDITQDRLNKLINEKYAKGAEKAKSELLESLGVGSVDDLKSTLSKIKEFEESQKTESQKQLEALEAKDKELAGLKAEIEAMKSKAEISNIANKFGFVDEEYLGFEYNKAKTVEDFSIDSWIETLKESKPFLFKESQTVKQTVKTDMSANKAQTLSFQDRLKQAKTQKELDALYKEYKII